MSPKPFAIRPAIFSLFLAILLVAGSFFLLEGTLRLIWKNPNVYPWSDYSGYVRLLRPGQKESYDISGLYEGAGQIRFQTGPLGEILQTGCPGKSWAIGGSTTECRYVPEDSRWPDLIQPESLVNHGSSGCALGDLYFNLKFLFLNQAKAPRAIYLMEAVNDLSSWEDYVESGGDPGIWARRRSRFNTNPQGFRTWIDQKIWLLGWYHDLRQRYPLRHFGAWTARDFYLRLREKSRIGREEAPLSAESLERFQKGPFQEFLQAREKIFLELRVLVEARGVALVLMTQPNSFREDYHPFGGVDLRDTPELRGGFASYAQTGQLLRKINEQTRQWSRVQGLGLVDLESAFQRENPSPLFYDSVHFTTQGSKKVAESIRQTRLDPKPAKSSPGSSF